MTEPADRTHGPPSRPLAAGGPVVGDEVDRLRGRTLGACAVCGRAVFFEQSFTRFHGSVVHVRCPISARSARPTSVVFDGMTSPGR